MSHVRGSIRSTESPAFLDGKKVQIVSSGCETHRAWARYWLSVQPRARSTNPRLVVQTRALEPINPHVEQGLVKTGITGVLAFLLAAAGYTDPVEAPERHGISNVRYEVTFDASTAPGRLIHVAMSFDVDDEQTVALSLPSWTPGSYQLDDFAKNVRNVSASLGSSEIRWDKSDFDTWRVYPTDAGRVTIEFDYRADQLDVGQAWAASDLAFFNGTNLFLYPEGQDLSFPSEIAFHTESDWGVATGLTSAGDGWEFTAQDYHELVDMPTFVGDFDMDSTQIDGTWYRLASYPVGALAGQPRATLWSQIEAMMPPMAAVTGDVPWDRYTTMTVFDEGFGGGSALEHSNSHLGVYHPGFIGTPTLASITAHEIFHAWNVKRIRPAQMWPYDYGRQMPTELLWVSEGITDYYADLALVRGGIVPAQGFYGLTQGKIGTVNNTVPVALEDASLSAWIGPTDGTSSIYYPKGSLAGFMLDILIRDASDNEHSLDDVMKAMYEDAYEQGQGFTEQMWWDAVRSAANGRSFEQFHDAFIDGRDPFPWAEVLPLAGLEWIDETVDVARIGISTITDTSGIRVTQVVPGGSGAQAGVLPGDVLVEIGGIAAEDASFGARFRARFGNEPAGTAYEIVVMRAGERVSLMTTLQFAEVSNSRIREGLLTGSTGR